MTRQGHTDPKTGNIELRAEPNDTLIKEMLEIAIEELSEIGAESDIWLVDDGKICRTHKQIYTYLKHRALRRPGK